MLKSNDSTTPVIQKSTDYTEFRHIKGNRAKNNAHIRRLEEAISENANRIKYNPILVNEFKEIIDGQHRFEAQKNLNLPIYFILIPGLRLTDAQELNKLSKPWSPTDYAKSYRDLGNGHYTLYLLLKAEYGYNHDVLMRYISLDEPITGEMFRSGKMIAPNALLTQDLCRELSDIGQFYDRYKTRSFALAFKQVWDHPKYDHERMLKKLSDRPNQIEDRALPLDYIRDLEAIFNHGLKDKAKVRFA